MFKTEKLLNIKETGVRAAEHIGKTVTPSNIAYLINYGRVKKRGAGGIFSQRKMTLCSV